MTKEEIRRLIDKKISELRVTREDSDKYKYVKAFLDNNKPVNDIFDLLEIDVYKFVTCLRYVDDDDDFELEVFERFEQALRNTFSDDVSHKPLAYRDAFDLFDSLGLNETLREYIKADKETRKDLLNQMKKKLPDDADPIVKMIIDMGGQDPDDMYIIVDSALSEPGYTFCVLDLIYIAAASDLDYNTYKVQSAKTPGKLSETEFKKLLRGKYDCSALAPIKAMISAYLTREDKENKKRERNINREISALEEAYSTLERELKKPEIVNIDSMLNQIKDEDIKLAFLQLIYSHNIEYYNSLEEKVERLEENSEVKYQLLLNDFGISKNEYNIEEVMNNSVDELKEILKFIDRLDINNQVKIGIIKNTDIDIIKLFKKHLNIGYISIDFLSTNIDLLFAQSNKGNIYTKNIQILNKHNINPNLFTNNMNILISNSDILDKNLELLESYYLLANFKDVGNYNFLTDQNLEEKIDKFIELGYENFLNFDLDILNNPKIERLELLGALNCTITTKAEFDSFIDPNRKFFIRNNEIDSYIPDVVHLKEKVNLNINQDYLETYRTSLRTYTIADTRISIIKVKRLLSAGYDIYDAIMYNKKLSNDQYEKLISSLSEGSYTYHI